MEMSKKTWRQKINGGALVTKNKWVATSAAIGVKAIVLATYDGIL